METCPCELVIVHGGPGETQPAGVEPGVSQRFAVPTGDVIPGLKMLFDREEDPVILFVMSVILTIQGEEQETRGFHEPDPIGNWVELTAPDGDGAASIVDMRRIPNSMPRVIEYRLIADIRSGRGVLPYLSMRSKNLPVSISRYIEKPDGAARTFEELGKDLLSLLGSRRWLPSFVA